MIRSLFHRVVLTLSLALILGCFYSPGLHSQTSGLSSQRLPYVIPTPGLPIFPQLYTDMTLEAFIGYVYMDSLARTIGIESAVAAPDNMTIHDLQALSRYIYGMGDYNPILLLRHFTSTADSSFPNGRYASYPANTYFNLLRVIDERRNEFGRENALLVISSYVLHLRVTATATGTDSTFYHHTPWTNTACDVVETFKGKVLPNNNCTPPAIINGKTEGISAPSGCVVFGTTNYDPNQYTPQIGDEFIICLFLSPSFENGAQLEPFNGKEGIFRIVDGKVEDPNNVWGLGAKPSLSDFKKNLISKINAIKNWTW
jgi:hypothetical protein